MMGNRIQMQKGNLAFYNYRSMSIADNLSQLVTLGLTSADISNLDRLNTALLDPAHFTLIAHEIQHHHVAFAFCQAIKHQLREKNARTYIGDAHDQMTLQAKMDRLEKIAQFNPFLSHLNQIACESLDFKQKSKMGHPSELDFSGFQNFLPLRTDDNLKTKSLFYQKINYLELLFSSLKMHFERPIQNGEQALWSQALLKIRDEVIGKLIIQLLVTHPDQYRNITFQVYLKYTESFLPGNPEMVYLRMINIINEAIYYLSSELPGYEQMKILEHHGQNLLNLVLALFSKITQSSTHPQIISTFIQVTYDLLVLAFVDFDNTTDDHQSFTVCEGQVVPPWLKRYTTDLLNMLERSMESLSSITYVNLEEILDKVLALIRMVSKNEVLGDFSCDYSPTKGNQDGIAVKKIMALLEQIVKISGEQLGCHIIQTTSYYLQYIIVKTLLRVFLSHLKESFNQRSLLILTLQSYFPLLLVKVPIRLQNGKNNPITMIAIFIQKMHGWLSKDQLLMTLVEQNVTLLLQKIRSEVRKNEFQNIKEEFQANSEYFSPINRLLQKFLSKNKYKDSRSFVSLLQCQVQKAFAEDQGRNHYLIRLSIELIRDMNNSAYQPYREQITQFSLFILQNLRDKPYKNQYLMLLDSILNLVLEENSQDLNSEFWYHTKKKVDFCLPAFISSLAFELINILLSDKSEYYISFGVEILNRTYCRFKNIEPIQLISEFSGKSLEQMGREDHLKLNKIMKIYFQPVYDFIADIDRSVLKDLKHYASRKKMFQLIGVLGIYSPKDLYQIYSKYILNKHNLNQQNDIIFFFIDTSGLLQSRLDGKCKNLLMELIVLQLNQNQHVFLLFSLENLQKKEVLFQIFISFIDNFLNRWTQISHETYYICKKIRTIIGQKIKMLSQLYSPQNANDLSKIYQSYSKLEQFQIQLPDFPQKIYSVVELFTPMFFKRYLKQLEKSQDPLQFFILYQNVFERKRLAWTFEEKEQKLDKELLSTPEKIEVLLFLQEFRESTGILFNINIKQLIKDLAVILFKEYVDRYSISSVDIGSIDDTDNEENSTNFVEEFFKSDSKKYIFILAKIQFHFNQFSGHREENYKNFELVFVERVKCLFYCQKLEKK